MSFLYVQRRVYCEEERDRRKIRRENGSMKTKDIVRVGRGMTVRNYVRMLFILSRFNDMPATLRLMKNNLKLIKELPADRKIKQIVQ